MTPQVGYAFVLIAFTTVVLGGMEVSFGALVSGLLLGVIALRGLFLGESLGQIGIFLAFILILCSGHLAFLDGAQHETDKRWRMAALRRNMRLSPADLSAPFGSVDRIHDQCAYCDGSQHWWNYSADLPGRCRSAMPHVGDGRIRHSNPAGAAGVNPWLAAALAVVAATLVAGFIAALSFRYGLRGSYFALVTLAFAEVLRILASSFQITGGVRGSLCPKAGIANFQFADRISTYTLVLTMVAVAMLITFAVQRSRFGAYLIAIRENEEAAKALGIDTFRTRLSP